MSNLSGYVTLASGYWKHGLAQNDGASLQLGVDYQHHTGFFTYARAANVEYPQNLPGQTRDVEVSAYVGYHDSRDRWSWTASVGRYVYPDAALYDYDEISVGFGFRDRVFCIREHYRDEHSLKPWESIPKEAMAEWIARRESQWQTLEDCTPAPIEINGTLYDPFEVDGLNMLLSNHGLLYGGGLTLFSKPTFFLAALEGRKEFLYYRIHYAGEELCRDLSASEAMLQGRCIFMRLHTLAVLLWEKAYELRSGKCGSLVKEAFSGYGIQRGAALPEDLYGRMRELAHEISDIFVLHEIGEAFEDDHHELWQEMGNRRSRAMPSAQARWFRRGSRSNAGSRGKRAFDRMAWFMKRAPMNTALTWCGLS